MKAECQDYYMIRTPNLPIKYLDKYECQELDIYEFIRQNKELDSFFRKALLTASPTLYKSYVNRPTDEKGYKNLTESLLKYFLRSVGRPTPYGYFASVALGKFDESTCLLRGKQLLDLRVDNNWINQIVSLLEKEDAIQGKLKVRYNPLCYISGDRVKNLYFTSHGKAEDEKKIIEEKSIRHTPLTDLLKSLASDFIILKELSDRVKESYGAVPETVIAKTLGDMIENEFLISDLRIPAYCVDPLAYIIQKLDEIEYSGHYLFELRKIQDLLEEYHKEESEEILQEIYKRMSAIKKNKNYLILNTGNQYVVNTLDRSIQKKIEKLAEVLYKIPIDFDTTHALKEKFMEVYGENVKVPLMQIIDDNRFDGGSLIDLSRIGTKGEEEILHIIDNKIQQAFINQEKEIRLFDKDFSHLQYKPVSVGSFDINVLVLDKDKKYDLWLGPNFGAEHAGAMTQRFSECFTAEEFVKYNQLYEKNEDAYSQYENVEIREFKTFGGQSNILNIRRNRKYCLALGTHSEDENSEIKLEDIYIGLDGSGIYAWSKLLGKKLRFITDNMLNPTLNNKITRLLLGVSREYSSCPISRLPSKYLMHKKRSKISPNTIRRSAFALSYYLNFLDEKQLCLDGIYQMKYIEQHEHFTDFLIWLKAGMHSREDYLKLPNNETCNAYLKEVFRFYTFMDQENNHSGSLKVLSDTQMIVRNSIGIRKVLNRKSFRGYLKEKGHQGKTIEQDKIVVLLQECANSRDQVLLLLLAETGFRIGELLGVRYAEDIDYEKHIIYVNFRDDNENGARAKNAELRRAKISDATFDILMFYIEDYKELIIGQEYLFINVSGDYVGKPFKGSGVYAMLRRLERKTGIKASPHMLRHYFANARRKDGWKLEMISQALGHRNIETTMKYLNITEDELIEVSDAFYNRHQAMYGVQNLL